MALIKVTYTDGVTVIYAKNLNDIQDAIIALEQGGGGGGAVSSVNGKTGAVSLTASDVNALPTAGGTMSGAIAMGGNKVTGLGTPQNDGDGATKKYVDDAITGIGTVFNIKGDVANVNDLPVSGNSVGDVYYVQSVSAAYVWLETTAHPAGYWEEFGEPIDLSGYIPKPSNPSVDDFLCFNGTTWIAKTVPAAAGVSF